MKKKINKQTKGQLNPRLISLLWSGFASCFATNKKKRDSLVSRLSYHLCRCSLSFEQLWFRSVFFFGLLQPNFTPNFGSEASDIWTALLNWTFVLILLTAEKNYQIMPGNCTRKWVGQNSCTSLWGVGHSATSPLDRFWQGSGKQFQMSKPGICFRIRQCNCHWVIWN